MSEQNSDWNILSSDVEIKDKISLVEKKIEDLEEKIDLIQEDNKLIISLLKENRDLYITAINNVGEKEDKNFKELKPLIKDTQYTFENYPTIMLNRITNRYWRNNYLTTPNLSFTSFNNDNDIDIDIDK